MRFLLSALIIAVVAFILGMYLPWWGIAVASFLVIIITGLRPGSAFFAGFLGIFVLWVILAWQINAGNDGILARRIAMVLPLNGSAGLLILVTAIAGGLIGGFAALTGSFLRAPKINR